MSRENLFVLVSGPPGSGKTTPAGALAARLRLPLIAKDAIHLDSRRLDDELWNEELLQPLGVGRLIEVDTTVPVDIEALANQIASIHRPSE